MNCAGHGRNQQCVQNFGRKTTGKGRLYKHRRRWLDNIKVDLTKEDLSVDKILVIRY